jgi:hypothetical protein
MSRLIAGPLVASLCLSSSAALGLPNPQETSVDKARAMLIREDLGGGVYVFRAPSDLEY